MKVKMSKTARSNIEWVFVVVAVGALVFITVHQMSMDGILPGNDPAVHLGKTMDIIQDKRVTYSEGGWYPPLFHTFLAVTMLLAGVVDVLLASWIVKILVASINVLILLATYLLTRNLLGREVAIPSAVFILLSTPLFEMINWGGYPNFLGIAFIVLIFYIVTSNLENPAKICFLFLVTFSLILTHQLTAFVFFILAIPTLLITAKGDKRQFLAFIAVVLASGLAILVWYAKIIFRYSSILISHLFFQMKQYTRVIPMVNFSGFAKSFGISIFFALAGIPLIIILTRKKGRWKEGLMIVLWAVVPLFLSQSYLFGVYLPYERFVYFLAIPVAILAGVTVYSLTKLPALVKNKICDKKGIDDNTLIITKTVTLVILIIIFSSQGFLSFQRVEGLPRYYQMSGRTGYDTGQWINQHSVSNSTVVVSEKPGAWLHVISNRNTIEEIDPLFERNVVAETVLHLFYEIENSHTLTREHIVEKVSGQSLHISINNLWEKVATIYDEEVYVLYHKEDGKQVSIPMSETTKELYWRKRSSQESQLVCEYSHPLFTLEKEVTLHGEKSKIDLEWRLRIKSPLSGVKLRVFTSTAPSLNFTEAFIPGTLKWKNPWDKPNKIEPNSWAIIECPPNELEDNITALWDAENNIVMVFDFEEDPDWLNVGAMSNRIIDAIRIGYQFGGINEGEGREASFSIMISSLESSEKRWNSTTLRKMLDRKENLTVEERDFLNYIEEYDVQFITAHYQQLLPKTDLPPILDRVYDTGEFLTYNIKSRARGDYTSG